ncbi:ZCHC3 protein, partial [Atractosteus spatula]|nr:ZCHC3 protein [Atractosteus spatula]
MVKNNRDKKPLSDYVVEPLFVRENRPLTVHMFNPYVPEEDVEIFLRRFVDITAKSTKVIDRNKYWTGKRKYFVRLRTISAQEDGFLHPPATFYIGVNRGYLHYPGQPLTCRRCGKEGHFAANCKEVVCRKCGETGHVGASCKKGKTCNLCGEEGHLYKDCPLSHTLVSREAAGGVSGVAGPSLSLSVPGPEDGEEATEGLDRAEEETGGERAEGGPQKLAEVQSQENDSPTLDPEVDQEETSTVVEDIAARTAKNLEAMQDIMSTIQQTIGEKEGGAEWSGGAVKRKLEGGESSEEVSTPEVVAETAPQTSGESEKQGESVFGHSKRPCGLVGLIVAATTEFLSEQKVNDEGQIDFSSFPIVAKLAQEGVVFEIEGRNLIRITSRDQKSAIAAQQALVELIKERETQRAGDSAKRDRQKKYEDLRRKVKQVGSLWRLDLEATSAFLKQTTWYREGVRYPKGFERIKDILKQFSSVKPFFDHSGREVLGMGLEGKKREDVIRCGTDLQTYIKEGEGKAQKAWT